MSSMPYLVLSVIICIVTFALLFLILAPILGNVGIAIGLQFVEFSYPTGPYTSWAQIEAACEDGTSDNDRQLRWACMYDEVEDMIQYIVPLMLAIGVGVIALKAFMAASVRGGE